MSDCKTEVKPVEGPYLKVSYGSGIIYVETPARAVSIPTLQNSEGLVAVSNSPAFRKMRQLLAWVHGFYTAKL